MKGAVPPRFSGKQRKRVLRFAIIGNGLPLAVATATDFSSHHTVLFIGAVGALLAPSMVQVAPPTLPGDSHRTQDLRGFAQVDVAPLVERDVEVEIDDSDIRVDTYRASGAGGKL
jgi:hypothetical protein